jgi:hypothetical protein
MMHSGSDFANSALASWPPCVAAAQLDKKCNRIVGMESA